MLSNMVHSMKRGATAYYAVQVQVQYYSKFGREKTSDKIYISVLVQTVVRSRSSPDAARMFMLV